MNTWDYIIINSLIFSVVGLGLHTIFKLYVYWRSKWKKTMEEAFSEIPRSR